MSYPIYYVEAGDTLPIFFDTFDGGTGASITMTGLAVTDIEIFKDGSVTQRASDAGYTLLDTDGIDFDSITGIHGFSIDLSDNTDAGFYVVGSWYHVVVSSVTVDAQTVNFVAAAFRIVSATRGMAGTALPDAAADAAGGLPISDAGGLDLDAQIGTDINAILADTNELQTDWVNGGRLDLILDARASQASVDTIDDFLDTEVAAVLADTNELQTDWANGGRLDLILDARASQTSVDTIDDFLDTEVAAILEDTGTTIPGILGSPAGASLAADIAAIEAQTDDIGAAGAGLTAVPWNTAWDAEVQSEAADALAAYDPPTHAELTSEINDVQTDIAALNDPTAGAVADAIWDEARSGHTAAGTFGEPFQGVVNGEAATGTLSTTQMTTNLTEATDDHFNGRIVVFITGVLAGQATDITDYTGATKLVTMTELTEAPGDEDRFVIV